MKTPVQSAPAHRPEEIAPLPDRAHCDRCGARAYVEIALPSGRNLTFCAHHFAHHESHLVTKATTIHDFRHLLLPA